ncbi:MAG: dockerin type I domain-containing protein [Planctomycetia bacterium]|nr:dockerin type I domain-containing protein [Planctomycetia bacterium]
MGAFISTDVATATDFSHLGVSAVSPYDTLVAYWNFDVDQEHTAKVPFYEMNDTSVTSGGNMLYLDKSTGDVYQSFDARVRRSQDNGATWEMLSDTPCASAPSWIFIDSRRTLFSSGWGKLFKRTSGDTTWTSQAVFGCQSSQFRPFGMSEDSLGNLYVGEYGGQYEEQCARIFKSSDGGESWDLVYEDGARHVHMVQVDPYTDYIYATTGDAGVRSKLLRSTDHGETWDVLQASNTEYQYISMVFTPDYRILGTDIGDKTGDNKIVRTADDVVFETVLAYGAAADNGYVYGLSRDDRTGLICAGTMGLDGQHSTIYCSANDGDEWFLLKEFEKTSGAPAGVMAITSFDQDGYAFSFDSITDTVHRFNIVNTPVYQDEYFYVAHDYGSSNEGRYIGDAHADLGGGLYGKGASFDGDGDYVDFGGDGSLNLRNDLTVCFWFNKATEIGAEDHFLGRASNYEVVWRSADNSIYLSWKDSTGSPRAFVCAAPGALNQWTHIAFSMSFDGGTSYCYLNGVEAGLLEGTPDNQGSSASLYVGIGYDGQTQEFSGSIDELMIFDSSLTGSQVEEIYAAQAPRFEPSGIQEFQQRAITPGSNLVEITERKQELVGSRIEKRLGQWRPELGYDNSDFVGSSGLVAYYHFDSDYDDATGPNEGIVYGDTNLTAAGVYGQSACFDGSGDFVALPDRIVNTGQPFTYSAWVKVNADRWGNIVGGLGYDMAIQYYANGDRILFSFYNSLNVAFDSFSEVDSIELGSWYYVAGVYDGSQIALYVDGVEVASNTISGSGRVSTKFGIGAVNMGNGASTRSLDGQVDEVMIFRRALSENEIAELYVKGRALFDYSDYQASDFFRVDEDSTNVIVDYLYVAGDSTNPFYSPALDITSVKLHAGWYRLGDANLDGTVDDRDASILGAHWHTPSGATWIDGDFNGDGRVDDRDACILAAHWGAVAELATPVEAASRPADKPVVAGDTRFVGPRQTSPSPVERRRLSSPREAASQAAFAEAHDSAEPGQQRLAAAWSYEMTRQPTRKRLISLADRLAAAPAVDLLMSGPERR